MGYRSYLNLKSSGVHMLRMNQSMQSMRVLHCNRATHTFAAPTALPQISAASMAHTDHVHACASLSAGTLTQGHAHSLPPPDHCERPGAACASPRNPPESRRLTAPTVASPFHQALSICRVSRVHHAEAIKTRNMPRGPSPRQRSARSTQHTLTSTPSGSQSIHKPVPNGQPYMSSLAWLEPPESGSSEHPTAGQHAFMHHVIP